MDHFCCGAAIALERSQTGFTWEATAGQTPAGCKAVAPGGGRSEGGVSGQRHWLAGAGLHGDKQRPNPAQLHNQWWEPKVVSSNPYTIIHNNRPPLHRSLRERSSPALRPHQANQQEGEFGGKLHCTEARAEIILSLKIKKKKSTLMCVALQNRKTFWLLRNRKQDTCLLHTSTDNQAPPPAASSLTTQLGLQQLSSSARGIMRAGRGLVILQVP